jgi:acetyltransferase
MAGIASFAPGAATARAPRSGAGLAVSIRRVQAHDDGLIDEFVRALSPASRQRRFHAGIRELPPSWLQRMTHPDACHELALVAMASLEARTVCVGEARYVLGNDMAGEREFALAVADDWQGQGIGRTLLHSLGRHAARHGVDRLVGDVLRDNLPMIELARGLGYAVGRHPADPRLLRVERSFVGLPSAQRRRGRPCQPSFI